MHRGSLLAALAVAGAAIVAAACSSSPSAPAASPSGAGDAGVPIGDAALDGVTSIGNGDPFDVPLDGVTADQVDAFNDGDALFDLPLREPDGLGPLYTRPSCSACHESGVRGPGVVQKMSVVLADGVTPSPDQSKLAFGHTIHPLVAAGATTPIVPPSGDSTVKVSIRVGPPVLGRGYMEAVDDAEIRRVAAEQAARTDGIHGRINMVVFASEPNPDPTFDAHQKGDVVIGRFGVKARIATLDEFTADALQGDMGITSPMRPAEIPNPDGLTDDRKPGVDETAAAVNSRATYLRLLAIPKRPPADEHGRALFEQAKCSVCHVPSLKTRADYPIALLANVDAPVYTDFLLHDMGTALSDGSADGVDGDAHAREWRTAPLVGLRFDKTYLHDGRVSTIADAILAHDSQGSEASESVHAYQALSSADRDALVQFVSGL